MAPAARKKRRLIRRSVVSLIVLALLGLGAWFAPTLLVHSPFWSYILESSGAPYGLHIRTGDVTLVWGSPVTLRNVTIRDRAGQPLADVRAVRLERSLWALLTHGDDLGRIHFDQPHLLVSARRDGSNVEDVVARLLQQPSSSGGIHTELQLHGGRITVRDAADGPGQSTQFDAIDAVISLSSLAQSTGKVMLKPCKVHSGNVEGMLSAALAWQAVDGALDLTATVHLRTFPIAAVAPFARRWSSDLRLSGRLSSDISVKWNSTARQLSIQTPSVEAVDFMVAGAQLGADPLTLRRARLSGAFSVSESDWRVKQVQFDCDAGHVQLDGHLSPPTGTMPETWQAWLATTVAAPGQVHTEGSLDFAQLARIAPRLLRIRADTTIEAGGVRFSMTGTTGPEGGRLVGSLTSQAIAARRASRRITWNDPLTLAIDARQQAGNWRLDKLVCRAEFLEASGQSDNQRGSADIKCDLDQLVTRLDQFIDIGAFQAAGQVSGHIRWERLGAERFSTDTTAQCTDFVWGASSVRVREPVVRTHAKGEWDRASGTVLFSEITVQTRSLGARAVDLSIVPEGPSRRIKGRLLLRTNLDQLRQSWQLRDSNIDWRLAGDAHGEVFFDHHDGTTAAEWSVQLENALLSRRKPPGWNRSHGPVPVIPANSTAGWEPVWHEPHVRLSGQGQFGWSASTAHIEQMQLATADQLQLTVQGDITQPRQRCRLDLAGAFAYDLAALTQRARQSTGIPLTVSGRDRQAFWVRGPLFDDPRAVGRSGSNAARGLVPDQLAAQCALKWQGAEYLGIVVGAGTVRAHLRAHTVETDPIDMPVSQGKLHVVPHIQLDRDQIVMTADPGPLLTDVQISRAMCHGWLKYVAPVAADATSAHGTLSVTLENAMIPFGKPEAADVRGTITVTDGQLGPGATAQTVMNVANGIKQVLRPDLSHAFAPDSTWLTITPHVIHFQVHGGRVYHDHLQVSIGDVVVRTHGSVGLDQSLDVVVEVPIQETWVRHNRNLAMLRGQIIEIPLRGTLRKTRVDTRALDDLGRRILRGTAGRVIENELNKGLKQLFGNGAR